MKDMYFEAREDKVDGGYAASAIGHAIHTQAETLDELRRNILDAVGGEHHEVIPNHAPISIGTSKASCRASRATTGSVSELLRFLDL